MTVRDFVNLINGLAPFETQESFDNSGLLIGSANTTVDTVLFALDVTDRVLDEAEALHAQLIITHHPLMFSPVKSLLEENHESHLIRRMIRSDIALIAAHTNLDRAIGGTNDTLVRLLDLRTPVGEGFVRVGDLPIPMTANVLSGYLSSALNTVVRVMGDPNRECSRLGLCSGGGSDFWPEAAALGADCFLSGEIRHHHALAMIHAGLTGFECGHAATEEPGIFALAQTLQASPLVIECKVRLYNSTVGVYSAPTHP